jgi:hypothetical protein
LRRWKPGANEEERMDDASQAAAYPRTQPASTVEEALVAAAGRIVDEGVTKAAVAELEQVLADVREIGAES